MTIHPHDPFEAIAPAPVVERGPWLARSTGGMWSILDPAPEDVDIRDIAAGLSRACRYNGQLVEECDFLAVSEHSTLLARWAVANGLASWREDAMAILLHDASEAFLGDLVTPLKKLIPDFKRIEDRTQAVIMRGFGLSPADLTIAKSAIKQIDERIRLDECQIAIADPAKTLGRTIEWNGEPETGPLGIEIKQLSGRAARIDFLETYLWCFERLPARSVRATPALERQAQIAREHLAKICTINAGLSAPCP